MNNEKLLTTAQAAEVLNVTRWRVNQLIGAGRLKAEKYGPIYLIKEIDLEGVKNRQTGRPPKKEASG